ncbi:Ig-like domain-containing protein [Eubacterium sp. An3]|uniref:Ig-like domain-containing protein n=1 Tax=Eubacterium sp. An3 TaxID=1965628 RepID=UPI000B37C800|nr:Ig-like domain-containing protein [Eubacterium sp. An3]OUO24784.1 hypothetical protein B5F87_19100 [Eubacterium sp. An3]
MTKKNIMRASATALAFCLLATAVPASNVEAKAKPKLSKKKVTLTVGKKVKLKVKNAGKKKVKWKTSNKKVAKVNKKGVVKAKKAGKATITAKVGKKTFKCKVTVKKAKGSAAKKNNATKRTVVGGKNSFEFSMIPDMFVGESVDLFYTDEYNSAIRLPGNLERKLTNAEKASLFKFSSSDKSIATVNKYGIITGKKAGTVEITAKAKTSAGWVTKTADCRVIDKNAVTFSVTPSVKNTASLEKVKSECDMSMATMPYDTMTITITNNTDKKINIRCIELFDRYEWAYEQFEAKWYSQVNEYGYKLFDVTHLNEDFNSGYTEVAIPAHSSKTYTFNACAKQYCTIFGAVDKSIITFFTDAGSYNYYLKSRIVELVW